MISSSPEWDNLSVTEKLKQIDPYDSFNIFDKNIAIRVITENPLLSKDDLTEKVDNEVRINRIMYWQC